MQAEIKKEEERELLRPPSGKSVGTKITLLAPEEKKTRDGERNNGRGEGEGEGGEHTHRRPTVTLSVYLPIARQRAAEHAVERLRDFSSRWTMSLCVGRMWKI